MTTVGIVAADAMGAAPGASLRAGGATEIAATQHDAGVGAELFSARAEVHARLATSCWCRTDHSDLSPDPDPTGPHSDRAGCVTHVMVRASWSVAPWYA